MEVLLILFFVGLICGAIAAAIAASKGRSAVGWFFGAFILGFLNFVIGIIMIVVVACLSNLKAEAEYRRRVDEENRRLREQVRQERMKTESFRTYTTQRLDLHDQALGIDTRTALPPAAEPGVPQLDWETGPAAPTDPSATVWFYEQAGQAKGPVAATEIRRLASSNAISPETLVWCEGMPQWAAIKTVPSLIWSQTV